MNNIFSKFLSLEPEKRERIINAAMAEFARKGYDKASTNEIVREANISKGLLFHYFKSKKDLFLFLYDYFIDVFKEEFFGKIDFSQKDFLLRFRQMTLLKMEITEKYPEIYNYMLSAYFEDAEELKNELLVLHREITQYSIGRLLSDIDVSGFKDGIDVQRAIKFIIWSFEGYANEETEKMKLNPSYRINYREMLAEFDAYLELVRNCFYK